MQETIQGRAIRRHESASTWEQRFEDCGRSGLSIRAFCRQHGVGLSSYYRWHLKLKGRVRRATRRPVSFRSSESPFIPVKLTEEASLTAGAANGWACEVTGPRRVRLRLRERPEWRELLQLLAVMAGEA